VNVWTICYEIQDMFWSHIIGDQPDNVGKLWLIQLALKCVITRNNHCIHWYPVSALICFIRRNNYYNHWHAL
jgi:hypothetical protein